MGRDAYLFRLAFGRSYTEPPEDDVLQRHPSILYDNSSSPNPQNTTAAPPRQFYDDRGHSVNRNSRRYARALRAAQNDVLAAVGVVVRNGSKEPRGPKEEELAAMAQDEHMSGLVMSYIAPYVEKFLLHWLHALKHKALVYPMLSNIPVIAFARSEISSYGYRHFLFAGLSTYFVHSLLRYPDWLSFAFEGLDALVQATVSSSRKRRAYDKWKPIVRDILEHSMKIVALPFELYYLHQTLGVAPTSSLLPPWKIFSSTLTSLVWPLSGSWKILTSGRIPPIPLAPACMGLLTYNMATSILVTVIFRTMRDSVLRPASKQWLARRRGYKNTLSETIEQLFEEDAQPWRPFTRRFSPVFQSIMNTLGWGWKRHELTRTPLAELPSDLELEREAEVLAWPSFDPDILAYIPPEALTRVHGDRVTSVIHDGISNREWETNGNMPSNPNAAPAAGSNNTRRPPRHSAASSTTDPPSPAANSDATIRITSSDSHTGVVNLEIGLPDHPAPSTQLQSSSAHPRHRIRRTVTDTPRFNPDLFTSPPSPTPDALSIDPEPPQSPSATTYITPATPSSGAPPPSDAENRPPNSHSLMPMPPEATHSEEAAIPAIYAHFRAEITRQRHKILHRRIQHRHQRVTMLSLYMSDNLASLITSKLVNALTLPWRAWMLREVARQAIGGMVHPGYGRVGNVGLGLVGGGVGWGWGVMGRVALLEAVQMLLEMGIWMGEWGVVRFIGLRSFRWGEV
ncbi:hypothetical protein P152DRAFT_479488 [Eremomyces bilateralis CBS 781.70]|uniref:Uncharacterized protein n=1 Tax=Eremomyces bilateralis CBS 781.70 TaxID=1392243 RepID=A0A6G1GC58_9PEZI|nr:uncharacterized protein P152DRAFT_479488 [Eremomyces bilateralis CBS 781.70]KAF1815572.1 hypothetical protein P152DRAFT_479488 [Eremomyces bilateralis CBS 781.70]